MRQEVTAWADAIIPAGTIANVSNVQWDSVSTEEIYKFGSIWDDPTAGNCLGIGQLTSPVSVSVGATFILPSGGIVVSLS